MDRGLRDVRLSVNLAQTLSQLSVLRYSLQKQPAKNSHGFLIVLLTIKHTLKGYSTFFLEVGSFYNSQKFYRFRIHSANFLVFKRISVTRQFLVSLTSIVYFFLLWKSMRPETVWLLTFF